MRDYVDGFVSRKAYESDFVGFLTEYASILKLPIQYIEEGYEFEPEPDYLFVNIDSWGLKLFKLREQGKIDTPFLIHFHVIFSQQVYISYLLPLLREDDVVVVGSEYSRRCLLNISDRFDVPVIPLALDVEHIAGVTRRARQSAKISSKGASSGKKHIAYLGQLLKPKGIGELIECMPGILEQMKGDVHLIVIGPLSGGKITGGPSPFVKELQERCAALGISRNVHWTGVLMDDDKYRQLSMADIFVNPSTFKIETFGVVNTEALACGLPVVCTRWSAFDEIIEDGGNGFLVDVDPPEENGWMYRLNREQLKNRIVRLLSDDALLNRMKQEARKSAVKYHYRELIPRLTGLLKKKEKSIKGRWDSIKDKTFLDFGHLFKKEWLDVMGAGTIAYKTYGEFPVIGDTGITFPPGMGRDIFAYLSGF